MRITNRYGLPDALVKAVENDPYSSGICDTTLTRLIAPPRIVALERKHADQLSEDVSDRLWSLFGQAFHHVLERAEEHALVEERYSIQRQGWVISGKFDRLVVDSGLLKDWKVSTVYAISNGHRFEWEAQVNLLALILRENGIDVQRLEVVVLLRDWAKSKSQRGKDYPVAGVVKFEIPMWSEEATECYIDTRIRLHQMARLVLPECSREERWTRPDLWAVTKAGRKSAVRVLESKVEAFILADQLGPDHSVQCRPGANIRCENYCAVSAFCTQWQDIKGEKFAEETEQISISA